MTTQPDGPQRASPTRRGPVAGAPGDLVVRAGLVVPASELVWKFSRASGPGGQGVNTTDSRAAVTWDPATSVALSPHLRERALASLGGPVTVVAQDERSQLQNRLLARERLAARIRAAVAPPPAARRATRPSRASQARRVDAKKQAGATKRLRGRPSRDE